MKAATRCAMFAACAAALFSFAPGCVTVDTASGGGQDMVVVENEGCFLLGFIPLFSGDPDYPNRDVPVMFCNTLKLETNVRLLEEEAARRGAKGIADVSSRTIDDPIIYILLKRKILQTSARLEGATVPPAPAEE